MYLLLLVFAALRMHAEAWTTTTPLRQQGAPFRAATSLFGSIGNGDSVSTRDGFLRQAAATLTSAAVSSFVSLPAFADETLPNGVTYKVIKNGPGPAPNTGELVGIRFAATYVNDGATLTIDNLFDTPEPYYTRIGSGGLIPGVEQALPFMKLGDRWLLTVPVS
jgi:FKBP-type peptidyl-prolyl cis-trans isomerase